jgi:hypothetical protein
MDGGADTLAMLQGFTAGVRSFGPVVSIITMFLGYCLAGFGLIMIARQSYTLTGGNATVGQGSFGPGLVTLLVGAALIAAHMILDAVMGSTGMGDSRAMLSPACASDPGACGFDTADGGGDPITKAAYTFGFGVIQLVGGIGFVKGVLMLQPKQGQQAPLGGALTHIIGGAAAINIKAVLGMIAATGGPALQKAIGTLIGV